MQFEIGISTNRYFPAIGTAGFDLLSVKGYKRDPCPPPKIMANVLFFIGLSLRGTRFFPHYYCHYKAYYTFLIIIVITRNLILFLTIIVITRHDLFAWAKVISHFLIVFSIWAPIPPSTLAFFCPQKRPKKELRSGRGAGFIFQSNAGF